MTVNKIDEKTELGFDVPALPGISINEIQTPCLILDMDSFDYNLRRMAKVITPYNVSLRAHAKMHKSVDVARQQLAYGNARGICCQKVSEAEVFAKAGITDILITNQICDHLKIERLAGIAALGCRLSVCVDDKANIYALSAEARKQNVEIHCLVELECGAGRCGVANSEEVAELAATIEAAEHLVFDGLQAYQGSIQHEPDHDMRKIELNSVITKVKECLSSLTAAGINCPVVSGGGTGSFLFEASSGVYTEIQCGSYAFMDADYGRIHNQDGERLDQADWKNALFLLTSIMSTAKDGQAVCDAGLKVLSVDSGLPFIFGRDDVVYSTCSDEHGIIKDPLNLLKINDRLKLIPGHCDPTCNLHDWYVCVRKGEVEAIWPISARGKSL